MADTKTQWILDLKDNMSAGIENIVKELSQLRKQFKQFEANVDQLDAGGIPEVKNETKQMSEVFTEASGSFSEMLGGLMSGDYAAVTSGIRGITTSVHAMRAASMAFIATSGSFSEMLGGLMSGDYVSVISGLGGITSGIHSMRAASMAFIATPIGAAIAGLATIGLAVGAWANYNKEALETNRIISQITQSEGELTSQIRVRATALQETFGGEWRENVEAAKKLSKSFGISYEEAFDTIEYGLIRGGNANKEFMDMIKEYPKLFEQGGFSAKDFIKTINAGFDLGIYQDKLPDAFKEFGLSVSEQTTASRAALENAFGKTFTDQLFNGIKDGSITTREALLQISNQTDKTSLNAQQQAQLTADLFRGAGEDAGGFLEIMKATNMALGDTEQALTATEQHFGAMSELNQELEAAKANALESDSFMVFSANIEKLWTNIKIGWYNTIGFFTNGFSTVTKHIQAFIMSMVKPFRQFYLQAQAIFVGIKEYILGFVDDIVGIGKMLDNFTGGLFSGIIDTAKEWAGSVSEGISDLKKEVEQSETGGLFSGIIDTAKEWAGSVSEGISDLKKEVEQSEFVTEYQKNLEIVNQDEKSKADAYKLYDEAKDKTGLETSGNAAAETPSGISGMNTANTATETPSGISGLGNGNGGGGKILNMELNITNHFSTGNASPMDIRKMADDIVGIIVGRLRDQSIAALG